jgi:SsrA-binding protein|tara:strand:+ start:2059 stop:2505 length:447 start_codon:yes stop_codon:yes gene_type:complete
VTKKVKIFHNRKARYNYEVIEKFEVGIVLFGNEIRSIREGRVVLDNSYAVIKKNEIWILNLFIDLKDLKNKFENVDALRPKKLLLKKKQIEKLSHKLKNNSYTMVPLDLHFNKKGFLKVLLAISKGRKKADLREYKKQQDWKKEKQKL